VDDPEDQRTHVADYGQDARLSTDASEGSQSWTIVVPAGWQPVGGGPS